MTAKTLVQRKLPVFPFYHHGLWSLSRPLTQLRKGWPGFVQIHLIAEWPLCCDVIYGGFKDGPTQFQLDRYPWIWLVADAVLRTNWRNEGEKDFSVKVGGSSCWHLAFSLKPVRKMSFTQFFSSSTLAGRSSTGCLSASSVQSSLEVLWHNIQKSFLWRDWYIIQFLKAKGNIMLHCKKVLS